MPALTSAERVVSPGVAGGVVTVSEVPMIASTARGATAVRWVRAYVAIQGSSRGEEWR
ncbi:MAG: hypothetical protein JO198_03015 [Candidatus Dormibacteraeota bacterium]|nr:hypothetical protein [Candidatus Dormibacteraeota bacterium]